MQAKDAPRSFIEDTVAAALLLHAIEQQRWLRLASSDKESQTSANVLQGSNLLGRCSTNDGYQFTLIAAESC